MINNYIILTDLFGQYGKARHLEGMFQEARMFKEKEQQKEIAIDLWERAFKIIKEMEEPCTFS